MDPSQTGTARSSIGKDELRAIVGDLDDGKAIEILNLQPTVAELEEAALWLSGEGDVLSRSGHSMTGKVAEIVEILTAGQDESPER